MNKYVYMFDFFFAAIIDFNRCLRYTESSPIYVYIYVCCFNTLHFIRVTVQLVSLGI